MLLNNKSIVKIKRKNKDIEYSITWQYSIDRYIITIEKYVNGYLKSDETKEYTINNLDILEKWLDLFSDCKNTVVKVY